MPKLYYTMKDMQYFWLFLCAPLTFLVTAPFLSYRTAPTPLQHGWNEGFQKCLLMAIPVPWAFSIFIFLSRKQNEKNIELPDLAQSEADPMQLAFVVLAVTVT